MAPEPDAVRREIAIRAPIDAVWELVTRAEHVQKWFAFDGARLDLRVGGAIEHFWAEHGRYRGIIEELVPPTRLAYRYSAVPDTEPEPGRQTRVVFELSAGADGTTTVRVTESGFAALDLSPEERAAHLEGVRQGWGGGFAMLAELAERREG
ncbi:SRPBCC domain-containing protein [Allonocardiopsis opalescens]|uniref:Uncharacterized protein YndB with AHSA1/START domain n=1 Tax=Allonocardiopsis opalescens TaxID=1144618 RepID=A0A2T0QAN1_9ACTN|nr:SRPBCC domain-containing protein [Allonocardiopsis opalescens]PRY00929.1 uncharacterized protein YndB with AHSA1/START domain [Allonocardiopsis opalescens]